jgi:hypothetical protein
MIENQIQNLLCLKIILEHGTPEYMELDFVRHTDEYKKELCMRYLGFIPNKEKLNRFQLEVLDVDDDIEYIINKYENFVGNFLDIKVTPPKSTHPNTLRYTKNLIDNMDKVLLRDLKLRYVIQ